MAAGFDPYYTWLGIPPHEQRHNCYRLLGLELFEDRPEVIARAAEEVTATGMAIGTIDYMAPEQITDSRSVDIRADIDSLGCTLYRLLAGHAPFAGPKYKSSMDKLHAHLREPAPRIGEARGDVPKELAQLLERMLAKDPAARPGTPCIGKASDGGDIGCRSAPEMIELCKVALELRRKGILKF